MMRKKKKKKAKDCNSMQAKITAINTLPLNREKKIIRIIKQC